MVRREYLQRVWRKAAANKALRRQKSNGALARQQARALWEVLDKRDSPPSSFVRKVAGPVLDIRKQITKLSERRKDKTLLTRLMYYVHKSDKSYKIVTIPRKTNRVKKMLACLVRRVLSSTFAPPASQAALRKAFSHALARRKIYRNRLGDLPDDIDVSDCSDISDNTFMSGLMASVTMRARNSGGL